MKEYGVLLSLHSPASCRKGSLGYSLFYQRLISSHLLLKAHADPYAGTSLYFKHTVPSYSQQFEKSTFKKPRRCRNYAAAHQATESSLI